MLLVNSPHNPTGAVASAEALAALAQLAQEHDLFVLSDEIYAAMVYDNRRHVSIGSFQDMKARTVIVNGFSKKYSMTGWRLGWVAADEALMSALIRIHQYTTVCATTFAQWGAYAAVTGPQDEVHSMIAEFDRRRILVYDALQTMPGIRLSKPQGAFYAFPNITGTGKTAEELTQYLLDRENARNAASRTHSNGQQTAGLKPHPCRQLLVMCWPRRGSLSIRRLALLWSRASDRISAMCGFIPTRKRMSPRGQSARWPIP
jgi:aspartate/methionine/tyrosine aminotransferase